MKLENPYKPPSAWLYALLIVVGLGLFLTSLTSLNFMLGAVWGFLFGVLFLFALLAKGGKSDRSND